MKWIEIIQLRTAGNIRPGFVSEITQMIDEFDSDTTMIVAYKRALVDSDVCIHIMHDAPSILPHGSPLGIHLVDALKSFGMTHFSVWSELPGNPL